ncbi:MAG TPA: ATP-binding cassette domain-containing protein [Candidatus Bathyarchaeia archaeon]|nr:ATP-binding cassette domain-containing protein [Candidatus Bathyarchaeia archaeon]
MSLVRLDSVTKSLGGQPVLDAVSFRVEEGEKVGLIGRNGTGKTTVFRLITGEVEADGGVIERMRRARIACLSQMPHIKPDATIFDTVMHSFSELLEMEAQLGRMGEAIAAGDESLLERYGHLQDEFAHRGGYDFRARAKRVLHGLGFSLEEFELPVRALSGGQRTRLMLALVLLEDADLLLLDEPENHLDIEAREWLETYIQESPRAVVIVSHDRRMLNHVVKRMVEVERAGLYNYAGNYDSYLDQKTLVRGQQQKAFDLQQEFIEKETKWINRFRYKNTKAKQVQSRIRNLQKMERTEPPPPEGSEAKFRFGEVVRSGQLVLDARGLGMAYGDLKLYAGLSFQVTRGERVGIIGPNGSGKTTLLRQLAGRLEGGSGSVTLGHKVTFGFYDQHHENLESANDILSEIRLERPDMTPEQVRTFMGKFLFTGDDVFKPLGALSGGELSRVALAKLILSQSNLLILDEPTNHLDIASRQALEGALGAFPGSLLVVSHDRELIDRLVDKLIVIENGTASVHLGNYSHYRWKLEAEVETQQAAVEAKKKSDDALKVRKNAGRPDKVQEREARKRRKQLEELEQNIESMEALVEDLEQRFAAIGAADYEQTRALKAQYDALKADLQGMYAEWEKLIEGNDE